MTGLALFVAGFAFGVGFARLPRVALRENRKRRFRRQFIQPVEQFAQQRELMK